MTMANEPSLYLYSTTYQAIFCCECCIAVPAKVKLRHLTGIHNVPPENRNHHLQCIPSDAKPRHDHSDFPIPPHIIPVPHLKTVNLWHCPDCGFLTPSRDWIRKHCRRQHPGIGSSPVPVQGQQWFRGSQQTRYWVINTEDLHQQYACAPEIRSSPPLQWELGTITDSICMNLQHPHYYYANT
jgi:hypothetical protein